VVVAPKNTTKAVEVASATTTAEAESNNSHNEWAIGEFQRVATNNREQRQH
jgi:hypothetical protein